MRQPRARNPRQLRPQEALDLTRSATMGTRLRCRSVRCVCRLARQQVVRFRAGTQ